jgi:hypothetical protein
VKAQDADHLVERRSLTKRGGKCPGQRVAHCIVQHAPVAQRACWYSSKVIDIEG